METLEKLKKDKRSLISSLTKYLNELAVELPLGAPKKERIAERLNDIEKRRDELLELLEKLQGVYKENNETTNVASIEEEADGIVDRVDSEMRGARLFLAKGVAKSREGNSNGGKSDGTSAKDSHVADPSKQLERIRIPNFRATRWNILLGGQRFQVALMRLLCHHNLKCCGWKVVWKARRQLRWKD